MIIIVQIPIVQPKINQSTSQIDSDVILGVIKDKLSLDFIANIK